MAYYPLSAQETVRCTPPLGLALALGRFRTAMRRSLHPDDADFLETFLVL